MGKLYRSGDRVIAGVCGGIAEEFGIAARWVRLIVLILLLISCGALAIAYILLAVILPLKNSKKSYAERMKEKMGKK